MTNRPRSVTNAASPAVVIVTITSQVMLSLDDCCGDSLQVDVTNVKQITSSSGKGEMSQLARQFREQAIKDSRQQARRRPADEAQRPECMKV